MGRVLAQIARFLSLEHRFTRTVPVFDAIDSWLPFHGLPLGCVHEVRSRGLACGISLASLLAARIPAPQQLVYIGPDSSFHPIGLLPYGASPDQWIHVLTHNSRDLYWTTLEALRCPQVSAVMAVVKSADLTLSRRWQLAAEASGATGFLLTDPVAKPSIASVITRWQVTSIPALAGAAFHEPHWSLDLLYCRGGRPAQWTVAWREGRLELQQPLKPAHRASRTANRLAV